MNKIRVKIKKMWNRIFPKYPSSHMWAMIDLCKSPEDLLGLIGENELTPSGMTKEEFRKSIEETDRNIARTANPPRRSE